MESLFSAQFWSALTEAVSHRKAHSTPESVTRIKTLVREAVRTIEADPTVGRRMRNVKDFPGCRLYVAGAWHIVYRARDTMIEFVALRQVGL